MLVSKKIIEYTVLFSNNYLSLIDRVNLKIEDGWQPLNGVTIAIYEKDSIIEYYQTMVKYE